ncbi:MAG: tRNA epoxyqueuosine(34) reductase QueG [Verrucomicrobiota bacterium]|jgi:epoxyqueuosine reductase
MKERIRQRARELGFDDCRFTSAAAPQSAPHFDRWLEKGAHGQMAWIERGAAKRRDPQLVLNGAQSIITLAVSYAINDSPNADSNSSVGVIARYARHADYHDVLAQPLKDLSRFVDELGGPGTESLWYVDTGPSLERDFAQRSGIGFVGKHTNVISRQLGNWILLAEILTTIELEPDSPERNRCGTCSRCLATCPTQAITAPFQLDARLCISYLTIELKGAIPESLRPAIGNRIFGCDDCLAVCPWNRFAEEGRLMRKCQRQDLGAPELLELLSMDETQFKQRFAGTPMLRAKRRGLLRNVCVALGNVAGENALGALEKASSDAEPLIAEHALWALNQIKSRRLKSEG